MQVPGNNSVDAVCLGGSENSCVRHRSERINHVWTYDFVMDRTEDGRQLKLLVVIDEYTRENLAIEVSRSLTARHVVDKLQYVFAVRGRPEYIRSDNGPEFVAREVTRWLDQATVKTLFIAKGSPWENGYVESFNGRFRDELLNREIFLRLDDARWVIDRWRLDYNHHRVHSALDYQTPAAFAAACAASVRPTASLQQASRTYPRFSYSAWYIDWGIVTPNVKAIRSSVTPNPIRKSSSHAIRQSGQ